MHPLFVRVGTFTFVYLQRFILKKILLLSDTHSHIDNDILKYVKQADEVWHAGDIGDLAVTDAIKALKPLRAVYGNIDDHEARREFPLHNRFMCEKVDVRSEERRVGKECRCRGWWWLENKYIEWD